MVFESFGGRPSLGVGLIFSKRNHICKKSIHFWIGALYMVMVTESFGYRPSPPDWSNLSQKVLVYKKFMTFGIKALYVVMVIESFGSVVVPLWPLISCFAFVSFETERN